MKPVTVDTLQQYKISKEKFCCITTYDALFARLVNQAGIDVILVGDSASNVMAGHETTLPITLDQMIYHAQCVVRGVERALVIVDLPFGSYQGNSKKALASAIRFMKEAGVHGVKVEGGKVIKSGETNFRCRNPCHGAPGINTAKYLPFWYISG